MIAAAPVFGLLGGEAARMSSFRYDNASCGDMWREVNGCLSLSTGVLFKVGHECALLGSV